MILTFDWGWGKFSEETDSHFQDVGFLQLRVACVAFSNQRQNQTFQVREAVVDTSTSSLFQQGFESLTKEETIGYSGALVKNQNSKLGIWVKKQSFIFLLTFLSSLACFLWATVDLVGRGWLASVMMLGLISFCCLFLWFLAGRYLRLERLGSSVPRRRRTSYLWEPCASEGREHKPSRFKGRGGDTAGGRVCVLGHLVSLGPPSLALVCGRLVMLRLLVFKMQTLNVHLIKLRTYDSNDAAPPSLQIRWIRKDDIYSFAIFYHKPKLSWFCTLTNLYCLLLELFLCFGFISLFVFFLPCWIHSKLFPLNSFDEKPQKSI